MSDKIPTSSRLDSLSRRPGASAPGAKPGLKFKPKTVARRTKEERAADAPVSAPAEQHHKSTRGGRGGARGGRGGRGGARGLAGTHIVQAGPLASGNALNDTRQTTINRPSMRGGDSYVSNLIKKESSNAGSRATSVSLDSDDDDGGDMVRINMNEEYKFSKETTENFPVRAPRSKSEIDVKREVISVSDSSAPSSVTASREQTPVPEVKPEPVDENLASLLNQRDTQLQNKLNELQIKSEALTLGTEEAVESTNRLNDDHRGIVETIEKLNNQKDKFILFQLPRVLPTFDQEQDVKQTAVKNEDGDISMVDSQETGIEGEFAKLRVHKSGKLSMKIGNVIMDVSRGSAGSFLQQVVMMKQNAVDDKGSYLLGHLQDKVVVTPHFS